MADIKTRDTSKGIIKTINKAAVADTVQRSVKTSEQTAKTDIKTTKEAAVIAFYHIRM